MQTLNEFYAELDNIKKNNPEGTYDFLRETLIDNTQCCGRFNDLYMATMSEFALYYREQGKLDSAIKYFQDLKDIIAGVSGTDSASYVSCLNNMAETYRMMGDNDEALKYFLNAANILESTVGTRDYLYGQVINNIGLIYMLKGEPEKAITNIKNAVNTICDLPDCREDTANALVNLGFLYNNVKKEEESLAALNEAIDIYEKEVPDSPSRGAAYNAKGSICFGKGDYEGAKENFEKARECVAATTGKNADYAVCTESLVYCLVKLGDREGALACAKEAEELYARFLGKMHDKTLRAKDLVDRLSA